MKAIYPPMYEIYQKRFEGDKLHGPHEMMIDPPPVDNLYAIYGINLETEAFCFVKKNSETGFALLFLSHPLPPLPFPPPSSSFSSSIDH